MLGYSLAPSVRSQPNRHAPVTPQFYSTLHYTVAYGSVPQHTATQLCTLLCRQLEKVEWDTLLFFYAVIMCVGGLSLLGFLDVASRAAYMGALQIQQSV